MFVSGKVSGFTYMEMIVVVVMLGLLSAMVIPKVIGPGEVITSSEGRETLTILLGSQKRYFFEKNAYAADAGLTAGTLDVDIPGSRYFDPPDAVSGGGGIVARVVRTGGLYTLTINDTGTIFCANGTVTCASIRCNKGGGSNQCNI